MHTFLANTRSIAFALDTYRRHTTRPDTELITRAELLLRQLDGFGFSVDRQFMLTGTNAETAARILSAAVNV